MEQSPWEEFLNSRMKPHLIGYLSGFKVQTSIHMVDTHRKVRKRGFLERMFSLRWGERFEVTVTETPMKNVVVDYESNTITMHPTLSHEILTDSLFEEELSAGKSSSKKETHVERRKS